ncbi:MAG: SMC family ATPase, partial [Propionibacteriaceae bacterium]|nr:SMC family ATPase [Propionibacteriaceae bacterium]
MRLHSLAFSGIGPFAGEHHIDFAALSAAGLFLLEGPTGAGKSTIIDAIVFALYGGVADASLGQVGGDRMRSDYASGSAESWVELVFEADGMFKVRRTPKYERPKLRGAGTITQQSGVKLWRKASPDAQRWDLVTGKVEEAAAEVVRVIGLSRDQFTQTVVLPQGQFASFLKADTAGRRPILQKVFGTWLYERWARELDSRRKSALDATRESAQRLLASAHELAGVAGAERSGQVAESAQGVAAGEQTAGLAELALRLRDEAGDQAKALLKSADMADQRASLAQERVKELERSWEAAQTKRRLESQLAALLAAKPGRERLRERLAAAQRAARAIPALDQADGAAAELERAIHAAALAGVDSWDQAVRDALRQASVQAETVHSLAGRRSQDVAEFEAARRADEAAAKALGEAELALGEAQEAAAASGAALAGFAANAPALAAALAQAKERTRLVAAYAQAVDVLERRERELSQALAGQEAASGAERELLERRMSQMGAALAAGLEDGQPCPVCGSTAHPAPAVAGGDQVSPESLAEVEKKTKLAVALAASARSAKDDAAQAVAELAGRGGSASPEDAEDELAQARIA